MARIAQALTPLPRHACRSITFDRGSEFIDWPHLQAEVGTQTWFCEAQSPWQKGAVENADRRLRRWLCHDTDPNSLSREELRILCAGLNATPRKCLGFQTPRRGLQGQPARTQPQARETLPATKVAFGPACPDLSGGS